MTVTNLDTTPLGVREVLESVEDVSTLERCEDGESKAWVRQETADQAVHRLTFALELNGKTYFLMCAHFPSLFYPILVLHPSHYCVYVVQQPIEGVSNLEQP